VLCESDRLGLEQVFWAEQAFDKVGKEGGAGDLRACFLKATWKESRRPCLMRGERKEKSGRLYAGDFHVH
jgi:hypothetical protein